MQLVPGGVQIQHDPLGSAGVIVQEGFREKSLHAPGVGDDLLGLIEPEPLAGLQPIQRALSRTRLALIGVNLRTTLSANSQDEKIGGHAIEGRRRGSAQGRH